MSVLRNTLAGRGLVASSTAGCGLRAFSTSGVTLAKKKADSTLPEGPKRPASAYTLFVKDWWNENRDNSKVTGPDGKLNLRQVASEMGSAWTALADAAKRQYSDTAKELKKAYDSEYKTWYEALTPETIKEIEAASGKKVGLPGGKKKYRLEQSSLPGNPGRPVTAFFEYMKEQRGQSAASGNTAKADIIETARQAGLRWKEMSEEDKQRYRDISIKNKEKYDEWLKTTKQ